MGAKRVGQRIHVYWTDETAWFSGVVQQFSPTQGYYVVYDDGDERWEGLDESYRFDGQQSDSEEDSDGKSDQEQEQEEEEDNHRDARGGSETVATRETTPRVMEPPGSVEDDQSETDDDNADGGLVAVMGAAETECSDEDDEEIAEAANVFNREHAGAYPKPVVLIREDGEENDTNSEEGQDPGHDDETRSVALSEAPITHDLSRLARQKETAGSDSRRVLPSRGILRGVVMHATNLPRVGKTEEPSAFTRVAIVEGGNSSRQSHTLMLRCKQTLAATQAMAETSHPVWNDLEEDDETEYTMPWDYSSSQLDGLFQLQVIPPMLALAGSHHVQPAWQQLKGDILFSVYHQDADASKRADFIGQASMPLHSLMLALLHGLSSTPCMQTTQTLPLESRQGKPISGAAEIAVRFQFEAEYPPIDRRPTAVTKTAPANELREPVTARTSHSKTAPSIISSSKSRPQSASSTRVRASGAKQQEKQRMHQSSSEINRRKFEKQLESENKAMAKRMADQRREAGAIAARRQQLNHQPPLVKSEPKPGIVAVKTAPPRSHKASSAINRNKFVDQVKQENKSMGKRLIERAGLVRQARRAGADAKGSKDELDWDDDKAQDKAHGADKRRVLRQEKDYLLEKAQAKYQQQNELVEEVMALQTQVADWKAKLFTVKSSLQRVDAMNTKDTHVRDCLRRATDRSKPATTPSSSVSIVSSSSATRLERLLASDDDDEDESNPAIKKHKEELRELLRDTASLESEQHRLEDQNTELTKQQAKLETEILELHRKWQFVEAKRAFHAKMAADRATPAGAVYANREIRSKKLALELSTEEEEQYAIFQAQEELTQLQIAATVLRDRLASGGTASTRPSGSFSSAASFAACEQLREKIARRKAKIESLEAHHSEWRRQYEQLVVNGEYDKLRSHAQELQHLLFLCQSEAKHVAAAERVAKHSKDKKAMDLQKLRFQEQTETEILLKSSSKTSTPH